MMVPGQGLGAVQTIDNKIERMVVVFAQALGADALALGEDVDRIISRDCIARISRHGAADRIEPADAEAMLHAAWLEAARRQKADVCPTMVFELVEAMLDCVAEDTPVLH